MVVYICSPLRGNPPYSMQKRNKNLRKAIVYGRKAFVEGYVPIIPHLYFSSFLNDSNTEERKKGIEMAVELVSKCDAVWVYDDGCISDGMKAVLKQATLLNKTIEFKE